MVSKVRYILYCDGGPYWCVSRSSQSTLTMPPTWIDVSRFRTGGPSSRPHTVPVDRKFNDDAIGEDDDEPEGVRSSQMLLGSTRSVFFLTYFIVKVVNG